MSRIRTILVGAVTTGMIATMVAIPAFAGVPADSVGVVDQTQGLWYLRDPDTGASTSFCFGNPGDFPIMGDWDCDGIDTPGLYRQSDGFVYLRNANTRGTVDIDFPYGDLPGGDAPPPGMMPPPTTPPRAIPPEPPFTFGVGTWIVGVEVPADTVRNSGFRTGCYWARLSGFSGELDDIVTNYFGSYRQIGEITATDKGFETTGDCGIWSNDLSPLKAPTSPLTPGIWQVGSEAAAGTWSNAPTDTGCYWARLSGFSGEFKDLIANDFVGDMSQSIVTVSASDVGFETDAACGTWTYLGP